MNIKKVSILGAIISGLAALTFLGLTFLTINFFQSVLFSIASISSLITFLAVSRINNPNNSVFIVNSFGINLICHSLLTDHFSYLVNLHFIKYFTSE